MSLDACRVVVKILGSKQENVAARGIHRLAVQGAVGFTREDYIYFVEIVAVERTISGE